MVIHFLRITPDPDIPGPSAKEYLAGTVAIGINGGYPGWSSGDDSAGYDGFDVALAKWLARKFGFTPKFVKIDPGERVPRIHDKTIKLAIANFSINPTALASIGMAGPYYQDESGIWLNFNKKDKIGGRPYPACVAANTTNAKKLGNSEYYSPILKNSLAECLSDFYNESSDVALVVSDKSILEAYSGTNKTPLGVFSGKGADVKLDGTENYGIGFPKGFTELCQDLNAALDEFIEDHWGDTFNTYLGARGIAVERHLPAGTNSAICS